MIVFEIFPCIVRARHVNIYCLHSPEGGLPCQNHRFVEDSTRMTDQGRYNGILLNFHCTHNVTLFKAARKIPAWVNARTLRDKKVITQILKMVIKNSKL